MEIEELLWGLIPIVIALGEILFSFYLLYKNVAVANGLTTTIIVCLNGYSVYVIWLMMTKPVWPSAFPMVIIGFSLFILIGQFVFRNKSN